MKASLLTGVSVTLFCLSLGAHSIESLPANELHQHCALYDDNPEGKDAIFCVRYIQGFIDGAIATDERVLENVRAEYETNDESFTERAIRIRAPDRRQLMERFGASSYADFCLGKPVPLQEVVEKVAVRLTDTEDQLESQLARDVVFATLRSHYPCDL